MDRHYLETAIREFVKSVHGDINDKAHTISIEWPAAPAAPGKPTLIERITGSAPEILATTWPPLPRIVITEKNKL